VRREERKERRRRFMTAMGSLLYVSVSADRSKQVGEWVGVVGGRATGVIDRKRRREIDREIGLMQYG